MNREEARAAYAEEIGAVAHLESSALVAAFSRVPREAFLGPGPWQIARSFDRQGSYRTTVDSDPRHIYHDVVVAIDPDRQLNNGQPSALARWIEAAAIRPGDAVHHIGCGVGYYTAILAELVGEGGRVVACEVDPDLADRARRHLAAWPQVEVETGDAGSMAGRFAVIFVNAGATHARPEWLAALDAGGRLILPLTVHVPGLPRGIGVMLRVERPSSGNPGADRLEGRWPVQLISQVIIYGCVNARDPAHEAELMALAQPGTADELAAVCVEPHARGDACLAHIEGFCLQRGAPR